MVTASLPFIGTVLSLAVLETLLSIDNAVILALMARELPEKEQKKALRYGLIGAVVFRTLAVYFATRLVQYAWVKALGGAYLLWLAIRYFFKKGGEEAKKPKRSLTRFWEVVFWIEVTDLVFAVDSILAAVAITTDYWAIVVGGILGVVAIRFAAGGMIKLLNRYPRLESLAYLLVAAVGIKVLYQVTYSL
jgi:YkoY family integral membrane protein